MMIIPLLLGTVVNTLFPTAGKVLGSFTEALMHGGLSVLSVFFICIGSTIDFKATPYIMKKGGILLGSKLVCGAILGLIARHFLGHSMITSGFFAGISVLAIVASINDTNGGLYTALIGEFGKKEDAGAYSLMSLESGAFFTMITLGVAGIGAFPIPAFIGTILPLLIGVVLGNLDPEMRKFLAPGFGLCIPFFAFGLGNSMNLLTVWRAGLLGILMGVAVVAVTGTVLICADRITGGTGLAGIAAASTAGNAAAVPAAIAAVDKSYVAIAPAATMLVSTCTIITAILVPIVTAWWAKRVGGIQPAVAACAGDD